MPVRPKGRRSTRASLGTGTGRFVRVLSSRSGHDRAVTRALSDDGPGSSLLAGGIRREQLGHDPLGLRAMVATGLPTPEALETLVSVAKLAQRIPAQAVYGPHPPGDSRRVGMGAVEGSRWKHPAYWESLVRAGPAHAMTLAAGLARQARFAIENGRVRVRDPAAALALLGSVEAAALAVVPPPAAEVALRQPRRLVLGGGRVWDDGWRPQVPGEVTVNVDLSSAPSAAATIGALPFPAASFDEVYLESLPREAIDGRSRSALYEAARVLKPGGTLVLITGRLPDMPATLARVGFEEIRGTTDHLGIRLVARRTRGPLPPPPAWHERVGDIVRHVRRDP